MPKQIIVDDLGYWWLFDGERVRIEGDEEETGGYWCDSFEEAKQLLIEMHFLSEPGEQLSLELPG
jgi:hypothetical protein